MLGRKISIPDFNTIFKIEKCSLSNSYEKEKWTKDVFESSLMTQERFKKVSAGVVFAEYFFPFCNAIEKFEQLFKMVLLLFVIDDHSELKGLEVGRDPVLGQSLFAQMEKALDKLINDEFISMSSWKPYTRMTYAIHETICNEYNQYQKKRFVDKYREYYKTNLIENELSESGTMATKSQKELIEIRKLVSGCYQCFVLIEYSEGLTITEEEWEDPLMQKYLDLAAKSIFYWNDIYSFEKEFVADNSQMNKMLNVVAITALSDGLSIRDSMSKLTEELQIIEKECQEVSIQLVSDSKCSEMKKIFIDRIKYMIGANYLGAASDRYNST